VGEGAILLKDVNILPHQEIDRNVAGLKLADSSGQLWAGLHKAICGGGGNIVKRCKHTAPSGNRPKCSRTQVS